MLKRTLPLVAVLFFACGDKADEIVIGCDTNPCEQHCDVEQVENYCADYDCGAHGQCAVGTDGPICVCDQGFTLQDGVCKESLVYDPCKGIVCAGGGTCAVIEGKTAVCLCLAGYKSEGAKCVLEEVPPSPCTGVTCSGHGSCVVTADNEAICVCDDGYRADGTTCVDVSCNCEGQCDCEQDCSGLECGNDPVCNRSCGTCEANEICNNGKCECRPNCDGRRCGPDPICGTPCGNCGANQICRTNGTCLTPTKDCSNGWCLIPDGMFEMGSPATEQQHDADEAPVHLVFITRSFYMKQTEVTQGEWKSRMQYDPSSNTECGADCPVEYVNWFDAVSYANALSTHEGLEPCYTLKNCSGTPGDDLDGCTVTFVGIHCNGYRLPTEAEWEYAARAGATGATYGPIDGISWHYGNSPNKTKQVGTRTANAWGLYDVLGNVAEWVNDWYVSNYYSTCTKDCTNPIGPATGSGKVIRGGSCNVEAKYHRLASRLGLGPGLRDFHRGFRLARTVPQAP